ncbi:RlpA-like double-psi beta-barrel-protein domain-containing protein-containing protein [Lipomyces arxii]|uniref:RlpA-like double-psi beta-barrel-protein domain-containing protein-containing protein n=1 Tax=Lipomyces arxii TaxID=56418 RepID=UPI0034CD28F7
MRSSILTLLSLATAALAAPVDKRDDVTWVTVTSEVEYVETVTEVATVYVYATATDDLNPTTVAHGVFSNVEAEATSVLGEFLPEFGSTTAEYVAPTSTSVYVAPTTSEYVAPTSTSVYVAPTTSSTSVYVAPTTSSVYVAPTTSATSVYVAPTTSTSSSSAPTATSGSGSGTYSGDGTFYSTGLGSCGQTSTDSDFIVAISNQLMSASSTGNPNSNPLCGQTITAYRDGRSVTVTVVDTCMGCAEYDLDFSPAAFDVLGTPDEGRVPITWSWDN